MDWSCPTCVFLATTKLNQSAEGDEKHTAEGIWLMPSCVKDSWDPGEAEYEENLCQDIKTLSVCDTTLPLFIPQRGQEAEYRLVQTFISFHGVSVGKWTNHFPADTCLVGSGSYTFTVILLPTSWFGSCLPVGEYLNQPVFRNQHNNTCRAMLKVYCSEFHPFQVFGMCCRQHSEVTLSRLSSSSSTFIFCLLLPLICATPEVNHIKGWMEQRLEQCAAVQSACTNCASTDLTLQSDPHQGWFWCF